MKTFGYHVTTKDRLALIRKEGLIPGGKRNFTSHSFDEILWKVYTVVPVFCTITEEKALASWAKPNTFLLKVDLSGLDTAADLGSLIDEGAYVEENGFWFKDHDQSYEYSDLFYDPARSLFIEQTKSLAVLETISSNRIIDIRQIGSRNARVLSVSDQVWQGLSGAWPEAGADRCQESGPFRSA